jgi:hypothetical protein
MADEVVEVSHFDRRDGMVGVFFLFGREPECQDQYTDQPSCCRVYEGFYVRGEDWGRGMFFYKSAESALSAQQLIPEISQDLVSRPHKGRLLVRTIGIQP